MYVINTVPFSTFLVKLHLLIPMFSDSTGGDFSIKCICRQHKIQIGNNVSKVLQWRTMQTKLMKKLPG